MRVLTIVHDHPDWTTGGTEIAAAALTRALAAREGVEARLLAVTTRLHRPEARPGALAALGDDLVLATGAYDRFSMLRLDGEAWVEGLGAALAATRPDVVHLHGLDRLGAEAVPAIRRLAPRARIVLTLHDYQLICPNDGLMLTVPDGARCPGAAPDRCRRCFPAIPASRHALRHDHLVALLSHLDRLIAPSAFLAARFRDWGIEAERITLLPNAVELAAAPKAAARSRPNRFAFFGNLAPHKGVLVLLDAAERLKRAGAEVEIALHGGFGWAGDDLRRAVGARLEAAAPVARMTGPYSRDELPGLMARTDWVVLPSLWWENAPLTLLEARAAGRPVIASGIGGMAELVSEGVDGLHVPPGDPVALAETIAAAAGDAKRHGRLARASRPATSFAEHVEAHVALFRSLTERVPA